MQRTSLQDQQEEGYNVGKHDKIRSKFLNSLKSKPTKKDYDRRINGFTKFLGVTRGNWADLVEGKSRENIEDWIQQYLVYLQEVKKVRHGTRVHYLAALIAFYDLMPDLEIRWKNVKKFLGDDDDELTDEQIERGEGWEEDRPYTREELQLMYRSAQDVRCKILILLMSSSGMRVGAPAQLRMRDLKWIEKYGIYQITVYGNSRKHKHVTFCTPQCAEEINLYLDYRKNAGEDVYANKGSSPLIRKKFDTDENFQVRHPEPLTVDTAKFLIYQVLTKYAGLRQKLEYDRENRRTIGKHEVMGTHGFRKFFTVTCQSAGVPIDFIEIMENRKLEGSRASYYKYTAEQLLEGTGKLNGYVYAIQALTISDEARLKVQNSELLGKIKSQEEIQAEIKSLQEQLRGIEEKFNLTEEHRQSARTLYNQVESLDSHNKEDRKIKSKKFDEYLEVRRKQIKQENELYRTLEKNKKIKK